MANNTNLKLLKIKSSIAINETNSPILIDKNEMEKIPKFKEHKRRKYKTRVKWDKGEAEQLIHGINNYGISNWCKIMQAYKFSENRTNVSLKDKYRNFKKVFIIEKE
ncbi:telomeric repeat binding factor 1 [Plasmodium gonderi]|uniref:Telomeric repeat binding factor 1 n=1 Tax=Plasmodium gonderi TaxID=77519 RepID=A0A1Y1JCQ8_PLAGO|nr:telomeric repeat binding factor 1 [Plasmodium gonderi]GAW80311.1 telomeric repeat binding factor 1 [Plasmodium gonderi]